jgi:hypothetical protein
MAGGSDQRVPGSWPYALELLERGEPAFVDELRRIAEAERLGRFAATWYADPRPATRRLLLTYLNRPLSAYRHEALVKRLFKLAEAAGDDEVMAHFLVLLDRAVRRVRRRRRHHISQWLDNRAAAVSLVGQWQAQGYESVSMQEWKAKFLVVALCNEEVLVVPRRTTMPRNHAGHESQAVRLLRATDDPFYEGLLEQAEAAERSASQNARLRLFSVNTRNYLRRRAWRYFRRLGRQHPERYVPALARALTLYEDADVADGLALLDNWGLVHALFHHSPVLRSRAAGWLPAPERSLAALRPAPMFEKLWKESPVACLNLLKEARSRPVRQWALQMLRRDHGALLASLPVEELLGLLAHADPEVAGVAAELLREAPGLDAIPVERWLAVLQTSNPEVVALLCELIAAHVKPERVGLVQAVGLATSRPVPVARLGLALLAGRIPATAEDCRLLLGLADAQAEPVRADLVRYARQVLADSAFFEPEWLLGLLDSRHTDVRAEGWAWLEAEPRVRDSVEIWRRLLESPYHDVRLRLVAGLEARVAHGDGNALAGSLDAELLRFLWASVLLNIHRGGKAKPVVVGQLVRRLGGRPDEAPVLLPILAVALRSVRGPEWRTGLVGVVRLVSQEPRLADVVKKSFPELTLA